MLHEQTAKWRMSRHVHSNLIGCIVEGHSFNDQYNPERIVCRIDLDGRPFAHQTNTASARCSFGKVHERFRLNAMLHFEIKWPKMDSISIDWLHSNVASEVCRCIFNIQIRIKSSLSLGWASTAFANIYIHSCLPSVSISHALHIYRCAIFVVLPSLANEMPIPTRNHSQIFLKSQEHIFDQPMGRQRGRRAEANKIANLFTIRIFYTFILDVERARVISNVNT